MSASPLYFFNETAPTEIYTLSLHDALPIYRHALERAGDDGRAGGDRLEHDSRVGGGAVQLEDHARHVGPVGHGLGEIGSTRLNSSHSQIAYAVFCLKKKKTTKVIDIIIRAT